MALEGFMLIHAAGCKRNNLKGLSLLSKAALKGSALANYKLGCYYYEGFHGLPIDTLEATRRLRAVVNRECKVQDISEAAMNDAKRLVDELEDAFESISSPPEGQKLAASMPPAGAKNETFDDSVKGGEDSMKNATFD